MRTRSTVRLFSLVLVVAVLTIAAVTTAQNGTWWPVSGHNLFNTHSQPSRTKSHRRTLRRSSRSGRSRQRAT